MAHSASTREVSRLEGFNHFAWHYTLKQAKNELLTLSKIEGTLPTFPEAYMPPLYAVEFVVHGHTVGKVNNKTIELRDNDVLFVIADHIYKDVRVSSDLEIYIIGFTTLFTDLLNLKISMSHLSQLLMHPTLHLTDRQMSIVQQYIELLRLLIEENNCSAVVNVVRSLGYYIFDEAAGYLQQTNALTRAEQICGQFLSMVEINCRSHHSVEWYAEQMHLSSKYLSNVLKHSLNTSPNACIDQALTHQAKSFLLSTSLSIQQISDRLGFQNQSHFGTFFKRRTSLNPSAFRLKGI